MWVVATVLCKFGQWDSCILCEITLHVLFSYVILGANTISLK